MKKRDIRKIREQLDREEAMGYLASNISPLSIYEIATLIAAKDVKKFKKKLKEYAKKYEL